MNIVIKRVLYTSRSTLGLLYINDAFFCFTLEPATKTDGSKPRAIPAGVYTCTMRHSARFNRNLPHVEEVPGFSEIMIHNGNYPQDTEGCLLVGSDMMCNFVGNSVATLDKLLAALEPPLIITYKDCSCT